MFRRVTKLAIELVVFELPTKRPIPRDEVAARRGRCVTSPIRRQKEIFKQNHNVAAGRDMDRTGPMIEKWIQGYIGAFLTDIECD